MHTQVVKTMKVAWTALLVIALLFMGQRQVKCQIVSGLSVHYGSLNGGTLQMIAGGGFADDTFNFGAGNAHLGNLVYFINGANQYECEVVKDSTTQFLIYCFTTPMPAGRYYVKVLIDGNEVPENTYCGGNRYSWSCTFVATSEHTPTIQSLQPSVTTPGDLLTIRGKIYTDRTREADQTSTNGRTAILSRVWVTGGKCAIFNTTDELYGVTVNSYDYGNIKCLMGGKYVASQNVSYIVNGNFGRSKPDTSVMKVSADYEIYSIQTYAVVDAVSPAKGSTAGGTLISISGNYMDDSSIQVSVGGRDCHVVDRNDTLVTCTSPAETSDYDVYPGSRGLVAEIYPGVSDRSTIDGGAYENYEGDKALVVSADSRVTFGASATPVVARIRGFFKPAKSGTYTLYSSGGGNTDIYLSTDHTKANKQLLSGAKELREGELYYMEAMHEQSSASINFQVDAYLEQTEYVSSQTSQSLEEKQSITTSSPDENEIQTITLIDWEENESPVNEKFGLCINCTAPTLCSGDEAFVISLYGITTEEILANDAAGDIEQKINELVVLGGDEVVVEELNATLFDGCTSYYTITAQSARGALPFVATSASGFITVNLSILQESMPDKNSFTLMVNGSGIPSLHVPVTDSGPALATAVSSLFGTLCPNALDAGIGTALLFESFEKAAVSVSGSLNGYDSYCGQMSLRYPSNIFVAGGNNPAFDVDIHPDFCVAYKGTVSATLRISYTYSNLLTGQTIAVTVTNDLFESTTEWTHVCTGILSLLGVIPGYNAKIQRLEILTYANDFLIDNVFIGKLDDSGRDLDVLRRQRRLPQHSAKFHSVSATKADNVYTVTMVPYDCIHNIPLLEIAYATLSHTGEYGNPEWGNSTVAVHRHTAASPPVGGSFKLTLPGEEGVYGGTTENIAWDAEAFVIENVIENLPGITNVHVSRYGDCRGYTWTVTYITPGGRQTLIEVGAEFENPNATIATQLVQKGGLYLSPISGDWLRVASDKPQVEVKINNVPSLCNAECSFEWSEDFTPTVTDVVLSSGIVSVTGTGFSTTDYENIVTVGDVDCEISDATETSITCTLGESPGGVQEVIVNVQGKGDAAATTINVPVTVSEILPKSGSTEGGTKVVLVGSALNADASVKIGDSRCEVTETTYSSISCTTGSSLAGDGAIIATVGGLNAIVSTMYTFQTPTASVISVSPTSLSTLGGETMAITGTNFGDEMDGNYVSIAGDKVEIVSWSNTEITVTTGSLGPGSYVIVVYIHPTGNADTSSIGQVYYVLEVSYASPLAASIEGGVQITLDGKGFHAEPEVKVGKSDCTITAYTDTSINCTLGSCGRTHVVTNTGGSVHGTGYAWNPSSLVINAGDEVMWKWSSIGSISGAAFQVYSLAAFEETDYDNEGFQSGVGTAQGVYSYQYNVPGTYYYGGCANTQCNIFMRGTVTVNAAVDISAAISVTDNTGTPTSEILFTCQTMLTPTFTLISPKTGTSDTLITVTGTGLSATSDPTVLIGGAACLVTDANDTSVSCKVHADTELAVATYQPLMVNVPGKGFARAEIINLLDRHFVLLPHIVSVSPTTGSIAGGTELTIMGGGLDGANLVMIGGTECFITETNYGAVTCTTGASVVETREVEVWVDKNENSIEAKCIESSCSYEYSTSNTPTLDEISPNAISVSGQTLSLTGTGYGTDLRAITVKVGETDCTVSSVNDTNIECILDDLVVGQHLVNVFVKGKGKARHGDSTKTVESLGVLDIAYPLTGSVMGGTRITIEGNGFSSSSTSILVGGQECTILAISAIRISCDTAPHTAAAVELAVTSNEFAYVPKDFEYAENSTPTVTNVYPVSGRQGDTITLTGTNLLKAGSNTTVSIGDVDCTVSELQATQVICKLGDRDGGSATLRVLVSGLGYASISDSVMFEYLLSVDSISPSAGSLGGGQSVTIIGRGFGNKSRVSICDQDCPVVGETMATSITCVTAMSETAGWCDVEVSNADGDNEILHSAYSYDQSLTPSITSVSPDIGGTAGGTALTITGHGLMGATGVTIDGSPCNVSDTTDTEIRCVTESHDGTVQAKVTVTMGANGIAPQDNANFYYIDRWSSNFTWGGGPIPTEGDFVVIPKGTTILFDVETPVLSLLLIQGGSLIFKDEGTIHLQAENILITDDGLLEIGTEAKPYSANAKITMHGHLRSPELPIYGAKTLGLRKGRLEMHGKYVSNTWTQLSETAFAGSSSLTLQVPVTWKAGDQIIIASTGYRHSQSQNEQRVLASNVIVDGKSALTLTEPLVYTHLGVTETYEGVVSVDYRAEVGLLSRNIVFRGSNDAAWNDEIEKCPNGFNTGMFATQTCFQGRFGEEEGSDEFGGSIMIHSMEPDTDDAVAHIEYVELTYVGQAYRLGRYPIHWHLMGNMSGSYVRGCAIHRSFNRAITIHNTHHLLVEHNVIYNIMGGAVFIEDGIETKNVIQYNLAVFVKQSTSLLNDDITPAAYWVTNPDNIIQHNAAAGGTHFGFWYRMHAHPDGPSYDPNICQQNVELGVFQNNTVHSQGWYGLWIFITYHPKEGGSCWSNVPKAAIFQTLTTWNCQKGAEWVNGGAIHFDSFVTANNDDLGIDIHGVSGTSWDKGDRGAVVSNSFIIGHADFAPSGYGSAGIAIPATSGVWLVGITFVNLELRAAINVGGCTLCGGFNHRVENVEFYNSQRRVSWAWEHQALILDIDGSFSGQSGENLRVLPYSDIYGVPGCEAVNDAKFGSLTAICNSSVNFHRLAFMKPTPSSLEGKAVTFENQYGNTTVMYKEKRLTHNPGWMVLLPGRQKYTWTFADSERISNYSYVSNFYNVHPGDWLVIEHKLFQKPDRVTMNGQHYTVENSTDLTTTTSSHLAWGYDVETRTFSYLVSGGPSSRKKRSTDPEPVYTSTPVNPFVYRCYFVDCIVPIIESGGIDETQQPPDDVTRVTDPTKNSSCFQFEGDSIEYNDVLIPAGCWVEWAIENVAVNQLRVDGTIYFDTILDSITLSATHILIVGRLIAGWSALDPHIKPLHIILRGNVTTPELPISFGLNLGAKGIGCIGLCDFHGIDQANPYVRLAATAISGSNTLRLQIAVSWKVGDEIAISTTDYNAWHTEKHTIAKVSDDGRTLTLVNALKHDHKYQVENYGYGWESVDLSALVAHLTRSIRIEGEEYDGINEEEFGARVLIGSNGVFNAKARFSNTEFSRTGQFEHRSPDDPRYSVAWLNAGEGSELKKCSFHDGFSVGVGVIGTNRVTISGNVVHGTVGEGMLLQGSAHRVEDNLIMFNIFHGTYNGRTEKNHEYPAALDISGTNFLTMKNNIVAGGERVAYKVGGQPCTGNLVEDWSGNMAHATIIGIYKMSSSGSCSLINGFTLNNIWDYGIYHQTSDNVIIKNCAIIDCTVGYLPIITGPASLSHQYADKYAHVMNSVLVGRSDADCVTGMNENTDANLIMRRSFGQKAPSGPTGGRSGIMLPMFASDGNGAPKKQFQANKNYPALHGKLLITGVTFASFGSACGRRDVIFFTNPSNEDAFHPTYVSGLTIHEVEKNSYAFIARPNPSKINPADCVDMQCDAKLKVLIRDMDGTLLGEPGAITSVAEYGWGSQSLGVGDFRIPKTMLTGTDGTRLNVEDVAPNKGIFRNDSCTQISSWQAYECKGPNSPNYRMLVIESLDGDTETRRLSPVALLSRGYIDLNNGPQDHGWCAGYTCQKRISTFHTIVEAHSTYELFFTGTPPRRLRLHLLDATDSEIMVLAIWIPNPQTLDVHSPSDGYILPTNAYHGKDGKLRLAKPPGFNLDLYKPHVSSASNGDNYLDRDTRHLYVAVGGQNGIVTIVTKNSIFVTFGVPSVTVTEFFEENLISNLALYLGIPPEKIRVVDVVREDSRRKRSTDEIEKISLEIQEDDDEDGSDVKAKKSNAHAAKTIDAYQLGNLASELEITIISLEVSKVKTSDDIVEMDEALRNGDVITTEKSYLIPTKMSLVSSLAGEEKAAFTAVIHLLDDNDNLVATSDSWGVTVTLDKTSAGSDDAAALTGTTTVTFAEGVATFGDLSVSHSGTYTLSFTGTMGTLDNVVSDLFTIDPRTIQAQVIERKEQLLTPTNSELDFTLRLTDKDGSNLEEVEFKGYTWTVVVAFDDPSMYDSATLSGNTTFDFDSVTGEAKIEDLHLDGSVEYKKYNLEFRVYTVPAGYDFVLKIEKVQIFPDDESQYIHIHVANTAQLRLKFSNSYDSIIGSNPKETLETSIYNALRQEHPAIFFGSISASETTDGSMQLDTSLMAGMKSEIEDFLAQFSGITARGHILKLQSECGIVVDSTCYSDTTVTTEADITVSATEATSSIEDVTTRVIIFSVLAACVLLSGAIVGITCWYKRNYHRSKVSAMRCMNNSQTSVDSGSPLADSLDGFQIQPNLRQLP